MALRPAALSTMLISMTTAMRVSIATSQRRTLGSTRLCGSLAMAQDNGKEGSSDFLASFAARRAAEKEAERMANRKPGQGPAKKADIEGLPIRLGGTTRDGSLGNVRAGWEQLKILSPSEWQSEEIGLIGILLLTVVTFAWGYNYVFAPDVVPDAPIPTTQKERDLYLCLADAFGGSEKLACNIKYGFGK
jgi:hypothetical protein